VVNAADVPATVLVVDDDSELRDSLVDCLSADYTVLEVASADAAVALLATASVDFVVSDVRMPGTMDGFGLAAWLRANRAGTPVLLITGYSERTTPDHPDDPPLWHKPFGFGQLLEYIRQGLS
jgi:CheY-like chemotaxis protein